MFQVNGLDFKLVLEGDKMFFHCGYKSGFDKTPFKQKE